MREKICDSVLVMVDTNMNIIQSFRKGNFDELSQFELNSTICTSLLNAGKRLYSKVASSEEKERLRTEIEQLLANRGI